MISTSAIDQCLLPLKEFEFKMICNIEVRLPLFHPVQSFSSSSSSIGLDNLRCG